MQNEFQYRLQKALAAKRITASELSRLSGVGKADISNYLNGKYLAKQDKVFLLAKALDVDPGWLLTGEEPTSPSPDGTEDVRPANDDVRLLIRGLNKLPPEQLKQATDIMRIMFAKYADYFAKEDPDNET